MTGQAMYQIDLARTANEPIAEGIHPFTVSDVEEGESSSQNPMWTFTLACNTPGEEGKTVRLFLVLTPNARWKLEQFLDAVAAPTSGEVTAEKFVGRKLRCQITHKDYEGRMQANIGQMWPIGATPTVKPSGAANAKPAASKTATAKPAAVKTVASAKTVARKPVGNGLPADATPEEISV